MKTRISILFGCLLSFCLLFTSSCSSSAPPPTEILWDSWGVPHIYAQNQQELFYANGWAQMQSHGNLILKLFGKSRGKAAEYWGGTENIQRDVMIHTLGFPELAAKWLSIQDADFKQHVQAFVKGMNAYAQAHSDAFEPQNTPVLPISVEDINLHTLFVFYTRFVGGGDLRSIQRWEETGSNTYAVAPSRSESGNALLVQNPHLPWFDEFLFYEQHGIAPGINVYGANLVGLPGWGIAFNEHLGWSHTNNTIDNADSYELTLKDGGYILGGEVKEFSKSNKTIKVKDEQGNLSDYPIEVLSSAHGPVIKMGKEKAIAIRFYLERPNSGKQWWAMAQAHNFEEFEAALEMGQIPFWNVMYADKSGNIFYLFNGHVPKRAKGDWGYWNRIIPGGDSEDIWTDVHTYAELPKVKNPANGWLQNANDPPWTCTDPMELVPTDFPPYMAPVYNMFRPQRSARMLAEDESITFDELVEYKLSTRMEMADRLLDDLYEAIDQYGGEGAREAKSVLEAWDKEANADSKGALLFYNWAMKFGPYNPVNYAVPFSLKAARTTPDGLVDPEGAVRQLEKAAEEIKQAYGSLDVEWGEVCRLIYNDKDLPANGADGAVGVFRVASMSLNQDQKMQVRAGDSWVAIIEFGPKVKAKVLMSYGNSTQAGSPHYGDQLELFSKKELRDAWFYREDVEKHVKKIERLENGQFVVGNRP